MNTLEQTTFISNSPALQLPVTTDLLLKLWKVSAKEQELQIMRSRRNKNDLSNQNDSNASFVKDTEFGKVSNTALHENMSSPLEDTTHGCLPTETPHTKTAQINDTLDLETIIQQIGEKFKLNTGQWIAFRIIAQSFIKEHVLKDDNVNGSKPEHLCIILTGPGGTGKNTCC